MRITEDLAKTAGKISRNFSWNDGELSLIIETTKLTIAFLDGKGPRWSLALSPLREELRQLEGFAKSRVLDKKG